MHESWKLGGGANIGGCNVLGCERGFGSETQLSTTSCYALSQYVVCAPLSLFLRSRCVGDPSGGSGTPPLLPGEMLHKEAVTERHLTPPSVTPCVFIQLIWSWACISIAIIMISIIIVIIFFTIQWIRKSFLPYPIWNRRLSHLLIHPLKKKKKIENNKNKEREKSSEYLLCKDEPVLLRQPMESITRRCRLRTHIFINIINPLCDRYQKQSPTAFTLLRIKEHTGDF